MVGSECFFDQQISDYVQHVAIFFEVMAIYLVWRDFQMFESDVVATGLRAMVTGMSGPKTNRKPQLTKALVIGAFAVALEAYQLATQYPGC